jgi:hypothetical protein
MYQIAARNRLDYRQALTVIRMVRQAMDTVTRSRALLAEVDALLSN